MNTQPLEEGMASYVEGLFDVRVYDDPTESSDYIREGLDTIQVALDIGDFCGTPAIEACVERLYCALADLAEAIADDQGLSNG